MIDYNDAGPWGRYDPTRPRTTLPMGDLIEELCQRLGIPVGPRFEFLDSAHHPHWGERHQPTHDRSD